MRRAGPLAAGILTPWGIKTTFSDFMPYAPIRLCQPYLTAQTAKALRASSRFFATQTFPAQRNTTFTRHVVPSIAMHHNACMQTYWLTKTT